MCIIVGLILPCCGIGKAILPNVPLVLAARITYTLMFAGKFEQ